MQSHSSQSAISRFGVSHAAFVTSGPAHSPTCHVAPATWRHTKHGECHHNLVLHQYDLDRLHAQLAMAGAFSGSSPLSGDLPRISYPAVGGAAEGGATAGVEEAAQDGAAGREGRAAAAARPPPPAANRSEAELMREGLHRLCREARAHADAPLLELRGLETFLLGPSATLLDRPGLPPHEVAEEMPRADWRWASLLQARELQELAFVCPGAASLDAFRKSCVGYFIAE